MDWDKPTGIPKGANDSNVGLEEAPLPIGGESEKMEIGTLIIGSMMLLAMAGRKKKPVFGQMTLTAVKALEFLKTSDKPFVRQVQKIIWIQKHEAEKDGWDVPHWVLESEKHNWTVILVDESQGELPLFVYQTSALQLIEAKLMSLEADGAKIDQINPRRMEIDMGDDSVKMSLWRNPKGGKFARYHVEFDSN